MKEVTILLKEDVFELLEVIARKNKKERDEFLTEFVENELVKLGYKILFAELEEDYEKIKERRDVK